MNLISRVANALGALALLPALFMVSLIDPGSPDDPEWADEPTPDGM